jgi:hypothetical protein
MHHHHRHHHHQPWGSSWGPSFGGDAGSTTLVNVDQQATAIAYGGGTAIAINYIVIYM